MIEYKTQNTMKYLFIAFALFISNNAFTQSVSFTFDDGSIRKYAWIFFARMEFNAFKKIR